MKKKLLSLVCALALTISLLPAAQALEGEGTRAAEALASLGLVTGTGAGYAAEDAATQEQAAALLVRLLGAEKTAKADRRSCGWAGIPSWARSAVNYCAYQSLIDWSEYRAGGALDAELWCAMLLRPLGCGVNPAAMTELKDQIKAALEAKEVEFVMGWQKGFDGLHATPLYMRKPEDVEKLIWGPLNVHSLATYLPLFKGKKVGIVVKGCDSRGVVELLQENLINREDVVVFGMGCNGTIDINRVLAKIGDVTEVESVTGSGATLKVRADGKDYEFAMQDVAQDKCRACTVPNAVIHDHFAGSPTNIPDGAQPAMPAIMTFLDGLSLEDRMGFWRGHIDRCIRCYACRNACPMCVCRDNCVADSREPHWLTQEDSPTQKMFFQLIHAMHLAGRCTGCGECNRACPMGIPVGALKLQMGRVVKKLFEYAPGMDVDAVPPLLGFQLEEKNIHEHHIEGA